MATLFNTKISATYEGLLKTIDNAAISATLKELTDGSGNQSGLYLNTAGDFKVTNVLEWGSLKDTGTGVTITRYVTSTDGLENFDNNTSLPTSAAVKLYVDTKFATSDTLQEVLSFGNTTSGNDIAVSSGDNITLTDFSKILIGASNDLQIYHSNPTGSFVRHDGTGNLHLTTSNDFILENGNRTKTIIDSTKDAEVNLYFNNAKKLETTNTGISITGIISNLTNPIDAQDAATKSYVDALDAGSDLDITDGTTTGDVNLNTQTLSILGTTNEIETVVSGQGVTIGLPSSISTDLVGNVTGNLTGNVTGDLTGNVTSTSVLANGVTATTQASTDSSTKVATTAYVKGLDNASDLDFSGDSGTGDVNLNAQTFAITGTANQIESSASNQGLSLQFPSAGVTLPNGSLATTQSADDNSTKVATTSYVDTSAALYLPLAGGIMSGNTIHNDSIKSIYGTGSDAQVYHDGSNFYINNSTGQLNIDQSAVTESIVFKTSDANALDTTALIINRGGDLITGRDVTIAGDLTVNGTTTTVNSQTLSVDDPLISLAINNAANSLDIGYYGKYNDGTTRYLGLYNDASDSNKFKLFKGTTVEPTTTVNIGAAGYVAADLQVAGLESSSFISTGTVSATSFISTTDAGININGLTLTRVAANTAIRTSGGLETLGLLRSYAGLNIAQTSTFGGDATFQGNVAINGSLLTLGSFNQFSGVNTSDLVLSVDKNNVGGGSSFDIQMDGATSAFYINNSRNVGIGTDNPTNGKLVIDSDTAPQILVKNSSGANSQILFEDNDGLTQSADITFDQSGNNSLTIKTNYAGSNLLLQPTSGNVGIGTDIPDAELHVKGSATVANFEGTGGSVFIGLKDSDDGTIGYMGVDGGKIKFQTSGSGYSDKLVIDTVGNVGIGTDSPDANLDILNGTTGASLKLSATATAYWQLQRDSTTGNLNISDDALGNVMSFDQLTGNVGIGTTSPSEKLTVHSTATAIQTLYTTNTQGGYTGYQNLTGGVKGFVGYGPTLFTGLDINNFGLRSQGGMPFTTGGGNVRMYINSAGNVGIGTVSPRAALQVAKGISAAVPTPGDNTACAVFGNSTSDNNYGLVLGALGSGTSYISSQRTNGASTTYNLAIQPNGGNVGIGTVSPDVTLHISKNAIGDYLKIGGDNVDSARGLLFTSSTTISTGDTHTINARSGNGVIALATGSVERMRITSGGDVLIGTQGTPNGTSVYGSGFIDSSNERSQLRMASNTTGGLDLVQFYNPNGLIGRIFTNGSATSYITSSDYRLKEDLKDFAGLDMVSKIPVYDYKWKADESRSYGVMAHELQEVLPDAVSGEKDAEKMQGVDYSKIVPLLIKSIQELKAEIDILKAK